MTIKNRYPLSLISKLISQLCGAKYFTKLDVCWSFNNICIKPRDEWKAAFHTNCGLFEPLVIFFGMTNSPATFQTIMNEVFWTVITKGIVVVYLDNILIFTKTEKKHEQAVWRVLEILAEHKLFLWNVSFTRGRLSTSDWSFRRTKLRWTLWKSLESCHIPEIW